jgi:hypothetical protein
VVTSGGGDEAPIAEYMNHFLITTGIIPVGSVWATMGTLAGDAFSADILKDAKILGRKLVHDWQERVVPPEIAHRRTQFTKRMRRLMMYRKIEWPFEYEYWKKQGRL